MYYPYLRGKQYELITVRENAPLLAKHGFVPIIEPVKESLGGLRRALAAIAEAEARAILIVNPRHGDLAPPTSPAGSMPRRSDATLPLLRDLLRESDGANQSISAGILLGERYQPSDAMALYEECDDLEPYFIHYGFTEARDLARALRQRNISARHVFVEDYCGKLYRRHFREGQSTRILLRDGFQQRRNRDHPKMEVFSDLHVTFEEEGMDGFGDFLIVGDDYSEAGGPAYAVCIHLTYIDDTRDDEMYMHHFKSDRQDTPTDPAGKFAEALEKLVKEVTRTDTKVAKTAAVEGFIRLHDQRHFPGLGYVKKLSMQHHIEILARYFAPRQV